jgi:Flp pilus assembly protein TadG
MLSRFRRDDKANVVTIFAFSLVPMLIAIGCATDYSLAVRMRSKMLSAADGASVASISTNSVGYLAAIQMTGNGTVAAGVTDANNIFNGNVSGVPGYTNLTVTSTVTKTKNVLTSNVAFVARVPTTFLNIIGYQYLTITGNSSSSASLPLYLDFYLMLDVSGSMGLPSTNAEQTRLAAINPDNRGNYSGGCTLACHFLAPNQCPNGTQWYPTNNMCMGYTITRVNPTAYANLVNQPSTPSVPKALPLPSLPTSMLSGLPNSLLSGNPSSLASVSSCPTDGTSNCIQLRADAVGSAVNQLFITANSSVKVPNQFRIGLYPFIQYLYPYFALTSAINGSPTNSTTINYAAANLASQLDTNTNASLGSGGTHFENAFPTMSTTIATIGDGSGPNNTLPYVFLITDGAEDPQTKGVPGGSWSGSNHATTLDAPTLCTPLKNRGIIISVLYIPYQPIQNPNASFANNEDGFANSNIANIPASLQACASPGFFYTANSPADITTALNAMFNHAVITAHITN